MKFFKPMTDKEKGNWTRGAVLGFYTYLLVLGLNEVYYLRFSKKILSSTMIFWSGLIVAFASELILNLIDRKKSHLDKD